MKTVRRILQYPSVGGAVPHRPGGYEAEGLGGALLPVLVLMCRLQPVPVSALSRRPVVTDAEDAPHLGLHADSVAVWGILTLSSEDPSLHLGANTAARSIKTSCKHEGLASEPPGI